MSTNTERELSIRGENVQRIYDYYISKKLLSNRKYQRKLVWSIEEKQAFIDSIIKGFPVPLILLGEVSYKDLNRYEIIDGMQRLNALASFIEGDFTLEGEYFDLETMAESKLLLDKGELEQRYPKLNRETCKNIASYLLPLSIYRYDGLNNIDEIFRRINSNGRHLSKQELRTAGATGKFAEVVRKISYKIRGDVSASDILYLNNMKEISITNKDLKYGIDVNEIFWVKEGILRRENVRESKDEEIIADIIAYMALQVKPPSNSDVLDEYFGVMGEDNKRYIEIENAVKKITLDVLNNQFMLVYSEINRILKLSKKSFSQLIFSTPQSNKIPRYFQVIFLALHDLFIKKNMRINNIENLVSNLDSIGEKHINLSAGGGKWSAIERENNVKGISGILESSFVKSNEEDPAIASWAIELENILMQSKTEQSLYDFKQGFHRLEINGEFGKRTFSKVIKTLTAMANNGPENIGYVIVGVADNANDKDDIEKLYNIEAHKYNGFYITGVNGEVAMNYKSDLDSYSQKIIQLVKAEPIEDDYKSEICRNIKIINYYDKSVLVFRIKATEKPALYDGKYYERKGPNVDKIEPEQYPNLFKRFFNK
ncbi:GmrSD restriction endonuclease domain-containing protein [Clostridium sulfidigenes]|uniref:GmrSD restriction endonuclease domain-containing protein n=1 Tax=Clostridium sulfidigenes TaxID=318464 RepID=UPI003F89E00B